MNRIVTRLRTLNSALPGLLAGILLYAVPTELIGLLLVPDKRRYTVGLLAGIALACYMAVHMALAIRSATDFRTEKQAKATVVLHAILRYGVVAAVFFLIAFFDLGYFWATAIGILGLKISAYLQPTFQKIMDRRR